MPRTRFRQIAPLVVLALMGATMVGCSRYRVRDLQTGNVYYAAKINENTNLDGAVHFTDAVTGDPVMLTHYETEKVSKKFFKRVVRRERSER